MKNSIRRMTTGMMLVLIAAFAGAQTVWSDQSFRAGTVSEISYSNIKVDDEVLKMDPNVKVLLHERRNDSIHERSGLLSDVKRGSRATVRLDCGVVTLIYVELYH